MLNKIGLAVLLFSAVACTTVHDLGNGRALKTAMTEGRSPFGTNGGFIQLQECDKTLQPKTMFDEYEYDKNCTPKSDWIPVSSQGVGGQIVGGALTGLGFGLGAAFAPVSGNAVQSQSLVVPAAGRHSK